MSTAKSQSGAIAEFDENFFSSIAVPKTKDYSRLSSSPSRDQPCDSSYFEKNYPNLECDTPVKMRLPSAQRESTDALPCPSLDMLSSSSSSENTVHQSEDQQQVKEHSVREPLKIVPDVTTSSISTCTSSSTTSTAPTYNENELIEGIEKMSMFAPKAPEERLSQRRRSEQKSQKPAERNASSTATSRIRSVSAKRSIQAVATSNPVAPPRRHNSVTRTTSTPISASGNNTALATGVVTRAMAARAAESSAALPAAKPIVRRSVMPLKVAQKTPVSAAKDLSASGGDRSRDRTRRSNTTNTSAPLARRSVLSVQKPAVGARTPIAPPRRSASANKSVTTSTSRPIAHANRSSMLRMNATKPAQNVTTAGAKPAAAAGNRNRLPLRVNPATPVSAARKAAVVSGQRPAVARPLPTVRSQSVERKKPSATPVSAVPRVSVPKTSRDDLFARLSTPKSSAARTSHEGPTASARKTAVRPIPSFIYNKTADGLPSSAGLHGIRAPSRERTPKK